MLLKKKPASEAQCYQERPYPRNVAERLNERASAVKPHKF